MMDKNREAFETWITEGLDADGIAASMLIQKTIGGDYKQNQTYWKWEAWQASRQAIEVDLPKKFTGTLLHGRVMANDMLRDCTKSITSLGIRVKGNEE